MPFPNLLMVATWNKYPVQKESEVKFEFSGKKYQGNNNSVLHVYNLNLVFYYLLIKATKVYNIDSNINS